MEEKIFASAEHPIRVSQLGNMLNCNFWVKAMFDTWISDTAGAPAQTGTVLHVGVEEWHRNGKDAQIAVAKMREALHRNPLADLDDSVKQFNLYIRDPRNQTANVVLNEFRIKDFIDCHPTDKTGKPIGITGQVDQVRRNKDNMLYLYDVKSSGRQAGVLAVEYAVSQLVYMYLVEQHLQEYVYGSIIIRTKGYLVRGVRPEDSPAGIFIQMPLTRGHYSIILDQIRLAVARIRNGEISVNPGEHCNWCGFQSPANCLIQLGMKA